MLLTLLLAGALALPLQDTTAHLVVVSTTDVHGHATAWDYLNDRPFPGGLTRAATVVDSLRRAWPGQVVLVDAGDLIQGEPFAAYLAQEKPRDPHPVLDVMGAMGYDAATPGNHEFNFGLPFMQRALSAARFPYVSANVRAGARDSLMFEPWVVVQRAGVRVGITGFTTPGVMVWDRENVRGRASVGRILPAARRVLPEMRAGADVVIALVHSGMAEASSYDTTGVGLENTAQALATTASPPDLVIVGHTHREMVDSVVGGVHFVQPRPYAESVSVVHLELARRDGRWVVTSIRGQAVPLAGVPPLPALVRRLAPLQAEVRAWATQPIASAFGDMPARYGRAGPTGVVNFVNEVQRRQAGAQLSSTPVFNTSAGFPRGEIRLADVAAIYPYENTLRAIRISGAQLRAYLEQSARYFTVSPEGRVGLNPEIPGYDFDIMSGVEYAIDLRYPPGDRIRGLTVGGRPVVPGDSFTLALNSYRQAGGGGYAMLKDAPVVYDRGENIRDLLIAAVKDRQILRPEDYAAANWRIVPVEAEAQVRALFGEEARRAVRAPAPRDSIEVRLIALNDFHGALHPRVEEWSGGEPVGGAARVQSVMDSVAGACRCATLRLDAGDGMQGSLPSNLVHGRSTIEVMNRLGIRAAAVGNHDFDWSVDTLRQRMAESRYPWLSANLVDSVTGRSPAWVQPWVMLDAGGTSVGVIGYSSPGTKAIVRQGLLAGLEFRGPDGLAGPLAALRARKPDVVVVLAHAGGRCNAQACAGEVIDLARALPPGSVDLILGGHVHEPLDTLVNGIRIVQGRPRGGAVTVVDILRTPVGAREVHARLVPVTGGVTPDSGMAALVAEYDSRTGAVAGREVARIRFPLERTGRQHPLGLLVAESFRTALRTDVGLVNNGALQAGLTSGPVTWSQVYEVQPFQNQLMRVTLSGDQLEALVESLLADGEPKSHLAGLEVRWDSTRPAGQRVREIRIRNGSRIERKRHYTLALPDFLLGAQDEFAPLAGLPAEPGGVLDVDALVRYLGALSQPVDPPAFTTFIPSR